MTNTDVFHQSGKQRTVLDCHNCSKQFVALIDYDLNGNHVVECPHCGHEHCRVIKDGYITGDRWDSRSGDDKSNAHRPRRVWKHCDDHIQIQTTGAGEFIRRRWLEKAYS